MRLLTFIVLCTAIALAASLVFSQSDEICSIWVNQNYTSEKQPPKIIFNYDGTVETYPSEDASDPILRGIFQVVEQWSDAEGVAWYKLKMIDMYGTELYLVRITEEGGRLEFVHQPYAYPQKIDETETSYCTYMRTPRE
jgi:hypothetical protein